MFDFIDKILSSFESCFSRKAAFRWFVILTIGLMLRSDKLGITSVIRDLALKPDCYLSMLHFFRASSWALDRIRQCWFQTVLRFFPLYQEGGFHVLVGDGVKQSKEGRRIPGVKNSVRNLKILQSRSLSMGICSAVWEFSQEASAVWHAFP